MSPICKYKDWRQDMMMNSGLSASDVAVLSGANNRNNDCWGGDGWGWIWILLIFGIFGGWGFGGFGGGFGGGANNPGLQGLATRSDINEGFALNGIERSLAGITQGICDSTYALNSAITNGFSANQLQLCNGFNGVNQGFNALQAQLAQCCCDNREAIGQVRYDMAAQACDTRNTIQNTTRDIIDNQSAGTRAILEKLGQMEYNNLNDKYQAALSENQSLKFAASQNAQNAFITANNSAQTAELIRRLGADCPQPAYIVQPPTPVSFPVNSCGTFNGCGNGCC